MEESSGVVIARLVKIQPSIASQIDRTISKPSIRSFPRSTNDSLMLGLTLETFHTYMSSSYIHVYICLFLDLMREKNETLLFFQNISLRTYYIKAL